MAIYVDDFNHPYGRMLMCHMIADTTEELLKMADAIGVQCRWIQEAGTPYEHFDICLSKKKKAIELGAVAVTTREMVDIRKRKGGSSLKNNAPLAEANEAR
jgi:hypothetical protein